MEKKMIFGVLITFSIAISAQTVINFETHALKNGADNPMSYCAYLAPGQAGENVRWDFQDLEFLKDFTGYLSTTKQSDKALVSPESNVELTEFNSRFYFHVDESGIEQYGYSSADGRIQVNYQTPFIKMKYPFAFGDAYSGSFNGIYSYAGKKSATVSGSYSVEADAFGTLVLPGNSVFEHTLRVRTEKNYTNDFSGTSQEVTVITYRWYNSFHRYPLLVLTEYTTRSGKSVTTSYQAAYNNTAITGIDASEISQVSLYPNPVSDVLHLQFESAAPGPLYFNIIDASGKLVQSFRKDLAGTTIISLTEEIQGLQPGVYTLQASGDNVAIRQTFTKIRR